MISSPSIGEGCQQTSESVRFVTEYSFHIFPDHKAQAIDFTHTQSEPGECKHKVSAVIIQSEA